MPLSVGMKPDVWDPSRGGPLPQARARRPSPSGLGATARSGGETTAALLLLHEGVAAASLLLHGVAARPPSGPVEGDERWPPSPSSASGDPSLAPTDAALGAAVRPRCGGLGASEADLTKVARDPTDPTARVPHFYFLFDL